MGTWLLPRMWEQEMLTQTAEKHFLTYSLLKGPCAVSESLRVHGLPWWTFDYKSSEESLKPHLASKKALLWWCWNCRSHTSCPALAHLFTNLKKLFFQFFGCSASRSCWLLHFCSSQPPRKYLLPFPMHITTVTYSHATMAIHSCICLSLMEKPGALLSSSQGSCWEQANGHMSLLSDYDLWFLPISI